MHKHNMEYADFKMIIKVTSVNGKLRYEFITWRADFIMQAMKALKIDKLADTSSLLRVFYQYTLGETEEQDKVLMSLPFSEAFEKGEKISVFIVVQHG